MNAPSAIELREQILDLVNQHAAIAHGPKKFIPGETYVPAAAKVVGAAEMRNMVDAALDLWLTAGRFNDAFEEKLSAFLGVRHVLTANSGSSANLLAVAALTSPELGKRALKPGDEVITVAAGFPTTVNPLILYGLVPVFVDIDIPTYNIQSSLVEAAVSDRTRAIVLAHSLGNPFDLAAVGRIARKHDLWLIEDCCDALGSKYENQSVGTYGDIGSLSFYPAHQITMGEGGAVFTRREDLKRILVSHRDWGRDCWCPAGHENTCGKRFDCQMGDLPAGYDHKFIYSHLGFNLKITDMQAAAGLAQFGKLPEFIAARKRNFEHLSERLAGLGEFLILPKATPGSDPCWFGYPVTVRENRGLRRDDLVRFLENRKIGTRPLFGGSLTRQPYFQGRRYRIASSLENTDTVMRQTFWVGLFPGLSEIHLDYVADQMESFFVKPEHGA